MTERVKITQEMIRLYDEYTHLTLDRRGFIDRLTRLAGSGAAAAAILPVLSNNYARAAIVAPDDARVVTERVAFGGASGEVGGYLARPADAEGPLPAIVVIHENRGLNPHIQDIARRLAVENFVALAVDFLSPLGGTPEDEDEARSMFGQLDQADTVANAVAAVEYLRTHEASNGNVGAVGFCWGGGMANQLAVNSPEVDAVVVFYGSQPDAGAAGDVSARLLYHYAGLDERINAGIEAWQAALAEAEIEFESHIYPDANHAFNNDTNDARYDQEAAELAWSRTVAFFDETLRD